MHTRKYIKPYFVWRLPELSKLSCTHILCEDQILEKCSLWTKFLENTFSVREEFWGFSLKIQIFPTIWPPHNIWIQESFDNSRSLHTIWNLIYFSGWLLAHPKIYLKPEYMEIRYLKNGDRGRSFRETLSGPKKSFQEFSLTVSIFRAYDLHTPWF